DGRACAERSARDAAAQAQPREELRSAVLRGQRGHQAREAGVHVTRLPRAAALTLAACTTIALPSLAGKRECAQSYVDAQKLMKGGALRKAREQLAICTRDECLAAVKKDCAAWLEQVTSSIPTIVVEAKGPDGKDTLDVKLTVDNEVVAERLDARAIELE